MRDGGHMRRREAKPGAGWSRKEWQSFSAFTKDNPGARCSPTTPGRPITDVSLDDRSELRRRHFRNGRIWRRPRCGAGARSLRARRSRPRTLRDRSRRDRPELLEHRRDGTGWARKGLRADTPGGALLLVRSTRVLPREVELWIRLESARRTWWFRRLRFGWAPRRLSRCACTVAARTSTSYCSASAASPRRRASLRRPRSASTTYRTHSNFLRTSSRGVRRAPTRSDPQANASTSSRGEKAVQAK
jgi:hypothetical protein